MDGVTTEGKDTLSLCVCRLVTEPTAEPLPHAPRETRRAGEDSCAQNEKLKYG
jgi:hypothetical protein